MIEIKRGKKTFNKIEFEVRTSDDRTHTVEFEDCIRIRDFWDQEGTYFSTTKAEERMEIAIEKGWVLGKVNMSQVCSYEEEKRWTFTKEYLEIKKKKRAAPIHRWVEDLTEIEEEKQS